jgi:diketogulonate reductase-like aldo/keto reductase
MSGALFSALFVLAYAMACCCANPTTPNPTIKLNNGEQMPLVSLGVWKYNDSLAYDACTAAHKVGFTAIDTAYDYANQAGVGKFINETIESGVSRDKLWITTKVPGCGTIPIAHLPPPSRKNCGADTARLIDYDLQHLGVDHVDLMLVHFPPDYAPTGCSLFGACKLMQEQWAALEDAYKAGKAKAIGVSNYCQSCFECILKNATVVPAVNQVQYHVGEGIDPGKHGLKSYMDEKGIVMMAYSAMGQGSKELISGPLTTGIGAHYNKSGAQVALKWVVQHNVPLVTKASNPKYLAQDIDLFDFEINSTDMAALDAATKPSGSPSFFCKS